MSHDGGNPITAGSSLTLTCTIIVNSILSSTEITVSNVWIGPNGQLMNNSHVTISSPVHLYDNVYVSTAMFDSLSTTDSGFYACRGTVSSSRHNYSTEGVGHGANTVTIQGKSSDRIHASATLARVDLQILCMYKGMELICLCNNSLIPSLSPALAYLLARVKGQIHMRLM